MPKAAVKSHLVSVQLHRLYTKRRGTTREKKRCPDADITTALVVMQTHTWNQENLLGEFLLDFENRREASFERPAKFENRRYCREGSFS